MLYSITKYMKTCTFKSVCNEKLHSAPCMLSTPLDFIHCCSLILFLDCSLLLYWIRCVSVFADIYIYIYALINVEVQSKENSPSIEDLYHRLTIENGAMFP